MHTHVLRCLLLGCAIALAQDTNSPGFVPIAKLSPFEKTLIDRETKAAGADFAAACINLTRDVQDKRLTVYAVVSTAQTGITNEAGFSIRVTYHRELEENYVWLQGTYQQHYNGCLLDFALAQYAEGRKALGLRLVRLLAEAEPERCWSSMRIQATNIKKLLASLEADDPSLTEMLKQAVQDWHQRERDYKP